MYNFCSDINGNCDEDRCECTTQKKIKCSFCPYESENDDDFIHLTDGSRVCGPCTER